MPRAAHDGEEEEDEDERDEDPSAEDVARFSRERSRPCQECGSPVYDEADICPKCHAFQWDDDGAKAKSRRQQTLKFALVIAVLATALTLSGLLFVFVR